MKLSKRDIELCCAPCRKCGRHPKIEVFGDIWRARCPGKCCEFGGMTTLEAVDAWNDFQDSVSRREV